MTDFESLAKTLANHPDYRVLRRLDPGYSGGPPIVGEEVRRAAILDVETTGMDVEYDQVIELGLIVFEYGAESGCVGSVVGRYGGFEDPGRPIPPEVTKIHHITDDMVAGKVLDEAAIEQVLQNVGIVIAHNAGFDRPFMEARLPMLAGLHWGCSLRDVQWKGQGFSSSALEFLAYKNGFFYDAHRAEIDCLAVLSVLARPLGDTGKTAFQMLLESARQQTHRVAALRSHFDTKDVLKDRGYRWNSDARVWVGEFLAADREAELAWLKEAVYGGREAEVDIETLTAKQRYSLREGKRERVRI